MSEVNLKYVREEAKNTIEKLLNGEINIATAKTVSGLLSNITTTAKVQVDYINAIPKHIKEDMQLENISVLDTPFKDTQVEVDNTLSGIEEENKKPYRFDNK